ncbi:MAG: bile acid:sodium symporter [Rhodospirillaceae bacterium]|nr:MAG: bile acid:sodium symporter [Rhodospirillaceae bacterium]
MLARLRPDNFTLALLGTVVLASILPARGAFAGWFEVATDIAIGLLFFLHGARLSRATVMAGLGHWRLHLVVFASTFVLFPLLGLATHLLVPSLLTPAFYAGILFLCVLPSTVQSSIAFTSIAGGNIAAAVCSASASNIIGMFLTPLLVGLLFHIDGGSTGGGFSLEGLESIMLQLLAPFIAGQILQPWIGHWVEKHRKMLSVVDRGSILMVVYLAFGAAVVSGLWHRLTPESFAVMVVVDMALLAIVMVITTYGSRWMGFNKADEITIVFCGSKKSLASGVPMAKVIFAGQDVGGIVLPLMLFHQIQLMVCAYIARRYAAKREEKARTNHAMVACE